MRETQSNSSKNSPYRETISRTKITVDGLINELGIIDINVNPEYIPVNILLQIQKKGVKNE